MPNSWLLCSVQTLGSWVGVTTTTTTTMITNTQNLKYFWQIGLLFYLGGWQIPPITWQKGVPKFDQLGWVEIQQWLANCELIIAHSPNPFCPLQNKCRNEIQIQIQILNDEIWFKKKVSIWEGDRSEVKSEVWCFSFG